MDKTTAWDKKKTTAVNLQEISFTNFKDEMTEKVHSSAGLDLSFFPKLFNQRSKSQRPSTKTWGCTKEKATTNVWCMISCLTALRHQSSLKTGT